MNQPKTKSRNLSDYTYEELLWLGDNKCKHGHKFISHLNCWLEVGEVKPERIGFLDIETSNLSPAFGIILCWCIKDSESDYIYYDALTKNDVFSEDEDKRIIETCIDTMKQFDRIVGHYSSRFDIPYLRTRAVMHDNKNALGFPKYGELIHTDTWMMAKSKFKFHSNRQNIIAETLYNDTIKTRINHRAWRRALQGNVNALRESLDHCEKDVLELEQNFYSMLPFYRLSRSSI
jgi:uncharacterized protein YprB with RNaseH-like and TPR domain